jgi:hypothetical protein
VGLVVAQTPRLAQTMSTLGASPDPIPAQPVYELQLAQSYVGRAAPTSAEPVDRAHLHGRPRRGSSCYVPPLAGYDLRCRFMTAAPGSD